MEIDADMKRKQKHKQGVGIRVSGSYLTNDLKIIIFSLRI